MVCFSGLLTITLNIEIFFIVFFILFYLIYFSFNDFYFLFFLRISYRNLFTMYLWRCLCGIMSKTLDFIIIIIILSCHQHRYPWLSLATPPYRSSLLTGPQGYILYPHRATVCRFELVALLLLGHVKGSIEEHHLWARPCFSSSVLHVWFV